MDGYLACPGLDLATNYYLPDYLGRPQCLPTASTRSPGRPPGPAGRRRLDQAVCRQRPHVEGQTFGHDEYSAAEIAVAVEEAARGRR